jgi:ATP-dependent DNA helicase RecG
VAAKKPASDAAKAGNTIEDKLARIGIARPQDLVLHLPLRYEDRTQVVPLEALAAGHTAQVEATVVNTEIQYRGRRQLV